MDINNAFPSKYLRSADLLGKKVRVMMERIEMENLGEDKRPIVYFQGKQKGLVLNKTNANTIADMWGSNTDSWVGKEITLFPTRVDFKGERVDAIRVEFIQPPANNMANLGSQTLERAISQSRPQFTERNPPPAEPHQMNDEIPF